MSCDVVNEHESNFRYVIFLAVALATYKAMGLHVTQI